MRQKNREITDLVEIIEVMRGCDVCRLGLNDEDGFPYVIPLNFGMEVTDGKIRLYQVSFVHMVLRRQQPVGQIPVIGN